MKVNSIQSNNNPIFSAGLTSGMRNEIASCDTSKISKEFMKSGVLTDFKGNKYIAWMALKVLEIFKKLGLGLPKGIFADNFDKMLVPDDALGFCSQAPSPLYKNSNIYFPERSVFFDSNINWSRIDEMSDRMYEKNDTATDFFLETFIHEFAHSAHNVNAVNKLGGVKFLQKLLYILEEQDEKEFQKKYGKILSSICTYAKTNQLEAVACDMSERIVKNINSQNLSINPDFIKNSPYAKFNLFQIFKPEDKLTKVVRRFWNGKFE